MQNTPENPYSIFNPYTPIRMAWLMFKVASLDRLTDMQKGLLYMNSLSFFSTMEGKDSDGLRKDSLEKVYLRAHAGPAGKHIRKLQLRIGKGKGEKVFDLGEKAVMTLDVPSPNNVLIFCMAALADDETGKIQGEENGIIKLDERLLEFGSHMLIIRNALAFSSRINESIKNNPHIYGAEYFQGGFGLVQYLDLEGKSGHIGPFRKDKKYSWQKEFRICFGVHNEGLNSNGSFELRVGDLSDITEIIPIQPLLDNPIKIERKMVKNDGNKYIEVPPNTEG